MDRNSLQAKCKTVACPGQEKPQNTVSQGWEGRCAGEVLNQDGLESWLELLSMGGQMPASRAVEAEVHPARHCGETWPVPGTSLTTSAVRSPAQGSLSVMDVEHLDQAQSRLQCPKGPECLVEAQRSGGLWLGSGLGTWCSQQLLPG